MFGKKIDLDDIRAQWDGNKPCYWASLCTSLNKGDGEGREYTKKDLQLVASIKFYIERKKMNWWEIKEDTKKDAFHLYYYPDINLQAEKENSKKLYGKSGKDVPALAEGPKEVSQSLEEIVRMFNTMLSSW